MVKRFYAVWGRTRGLEPGVYEEEWDVLGTKLLDGFCRVSSRLEGEEMVRTRGHAWVSFWRPKAALMHHRCWYCGRVTNPNTSSKPDSAETEHQVPRYTEWAQVDWEENIVVACHRCNNGKFPGKGDRDVQAFRERLQDSYEGRVVFYGEVLRWLQRHGDAIGLATSGLNEEQARRALSLYRGKPPVRFHAWPTFDSIDPHEDSPGELPADYLSGLAHPIPPDGPPYALGAPERLTAYNPPRARGGASRDEGASPGKERF